MISRNKRKGQTALEYALVVGVLAVGIVALSKFLFNGKESPVGSLFSSSVSKASEQVNGNNPPD